MTEDIITIEAAVRACTQALRLAGSIDALGDALASVGRRFSMNQLMITNVDEVAAMPAAAVKYSARSLPDLRQFFRGRPLKDHPLFRRAWGREAPISQSELRNELNLSESELREMMPPWSHGNEALSVNIQIDPLTRLNFAYAGVGADVGATARSVLLVVSHLACERLDELQRARPMPTHLTQREEVALRMIAAGKSDEEVGAALGITARTVRFHIDNVKTKLGVANRTHAVLKFLRGKLS